MRPMLDPKRDLAGATPETLVRALFRRTEPLRPRSGRESVISDETAVGESAPHEPEDDESAFGQGYLTSRTLCLPANSWTYRSRCLGLILWNVPV